MRHFAAAIIAIILWSVQQAHNRRRAQRSRQRDAYCSFAYSALACFRMGMSESASFQRVRKSL